MGRALCGLACIIGCCGGTNSIGCSSLGRTLVAVPTTGIIIIGRANIGLTGLGDSVGMVVVQ